MLISWIAKKTASYSIPAKIGSIIQYTEWNNPEYKLYFCKYGEIGYQNKAVSMDHIYMDNFH